MQPRWPWMLSLLPLPTPSLLLPRLPPVASPLLLLGGGINRQQWGCWCWWWWADPSNIRGALGTSTDKRKWGGSTPMHRQWFLLCLWRHLNHHVTALIYGGGIFWWQRGQSWWTGIKNSSRLGYSYNNKLIVKSDEHWGEADRRRVYGHCALIIIYYLGKDEKSTHWDGRGYKKCCLNRYDEDEGIQQTRIQLWV